MLDTTSKDLDSNAVKSSESSTIPPEGSLQARHSNNVEHSEVLSNNHVYLKLLVHSLAMFTLPFVAFFGVRRFALHEFSVAEMQADMYATAVAVVVVNLVIGSYIYQALTEDQGHKHKD